MSARRLSQSRAERIIAASRLVLALASFAAIYIDPLEPSVHPAFTYGLLGGYAFYALVVCVWTVISAATTLEWQIASHVLDMTFFGVINYMTFGPTSPFFIFFVFSTMCAMLRFGRGGTLLTAAAAMIVFGASSIGRVGEADFELNRFIIRLTYLGVMASMLFYLAAYHQRLQHDLQRIARWPRTPRRDQHELVERLMEEAASIFGAGRVLLSYSFLSERYAFLGQRTSAGFEALLQADEISALLLDRHGGSYVSSGSLIKATVDFEETNSSRTARTNPASGVAQEIADRYAIAEVVATSFRGEFVHGRLLLLDGGLPMLEEINLARIAGGVIAGRLDHYHASQQLQRGAVAEDRVRVARDLHDSVLQSLTGVALQLHTLPKLFRVNLEEATRRSAEIEQVLAATQKELRWFIE